MRTKLLLPLVALAILATALPVSAQESADTEATLVLNEPIMVYVGDGTYVLSMNRDGAPFPVPYDVIVIERAVETQSGVPAGDTERRGPQRL